MTAFTKFEVAGPDARDYLNHLTTGIVPKTIGRIGLNYVLTEQGRIETEVTITRVNEDVYYIISGPVAHIRDIDWFNQHTAKPGTDSSAKADHFDVTITDRTTEIGTLAVAGPNARALMHAVSDADFSNEGFAFLTAKEVKVAGVAVRALRVGFSGSRGWEIHVPMDQMLEVYDGLMVASEANGLGAVDVGSHALNSLRMEKAYLTRFELTHDIGPYQAGIGRWVRPQKGDFIGRDALWQADKTAGYESSPGSVGNDWRLVYLDIDVPDELGAADCVGGEAVFHGQDAVGITTSGGYGFTVDKSLAFAYVGEQASAPGTALSVLILNVERSAVVLDGPIFDPDNEHLLG